MTILGVIGVEIVLMDLRFEICAIHISNAHIPSKCVYVEKKPRLRNANFKSRDKWEQAVKMNGGGDGVLRTFCV